MRHTLNILAASAAFLIGAAAVAQAAPSGTLVTNTISMSYTSGGNTISDPAAASVSFLVDKKVDLSVTGVNAGGIVYGEPSQNSVALTYMLENQGNDPSGFDINVANLGGIEVDSDPAGGGAEGSYFLKLSASVDPNDPGTVYDATGPVNAGDLASGANTYVHVIANLRNSAINLETEDFDIRATALEVGTNTVQLELLGQGLNAVDIVFADPGENGFEEATQQIIVAGAELTSSKVVNVISENLHGGFNCAVGAAVPGAENAVPGACVEYVITVSNGPGASRSGSNLEIVDALPSGVTYEGHTITGFDSASHAAGTVTAEVARLDPGDTAVLRIRATIGN